MVSFVGAMKNLFVVLQLKLAPRWFPGGDAFSFPLFCLIVYSATLLLPLKARLTISEAFHVGGQELHLT